MQKRPEALLWDRACSFTGTPKQLVIREEFLTLPSSRELEQLHQNSSATSTGGQVGASLASQISGSFTAPDGTTVSFNGVTDVIGRPQSEVPPPFDNVRDFLMDQYPGQFLLELPDGSKDYGSVPITLWVPSSVPCPSGNLEPGRSLLKVSR